jgi:outer membrane protein TolC
MKKGLIMLGGITVLLFLFCSFVSGYEEGETGAPALDKIEVNDRVDGIDITLVSSRPLDYTVYEADNPTRIVVDLIGTNIYTQLPRKLAVNKPYLKEVSLRWYGPAPEKEFDAAKVDLVEMVLSEKINYKVKAKDNRITVSFDLPGYQPEGAKVEPKTRTAVVRLDPVNVEEEIEWEKWVELGLANYKPLHIAHEQIELAQIKVREAKRQLFPVTVIKASQTTGDTAVQDVSFTERSIGVQVEQPLTYSGELRYKIDQALVNMDISQKEYQRIKSDYILEVKRSYYNLLLYLMNANIYEQVFKEAGEIMDLAKKQLDAKLITQLEFLNVQSLYSQLKYQLVSAEKDRALAELTFKQTLNVDVTAPLEIEPWLRFEKLDLNMEKCKDVAFKNRPEMVINELIVKFNELGQKIADSKEKLKVSLNGFLGQSASAYDTEKLNMEADWFLGLKLTKPFGGNTMTTSFTKEETTPKLSLSQEKTGTMSGNMEFSLLDGLGRLTDKKSASVEYLRSVNELWEVRDTIRAEVTSSFNEYQKGLYQLDNIQERIDFQKKRAEVTEARWKFNEASLADILEAKIALASEKANLNNLLANYYVALSTLTKACGLYKYAELVTGRSGEVLWHRVEGVPVDQKDYAKLNKEIFIPQGEEVINIEDLAGGKVIAVNNENGFAIINLGETQGVREGSELWVYRSREKVAVLKVSKLRKSTSSCKIARAEADGKIRLGDMVKVIP